MEKWKKNLFYIDFSFFVDVDVFQDLRNEEKFFSLFSLIQQSIIRVMKKKKKMKTRKRIFNIKLYSFTSTDNSCFFICFCFNRIFFSWRIAMSSKLVENIEFYKKIPQSFLSCYDLMSCIFLSNSKINFLVVISTTNERTREREEASFDLFCTSMKRRKNWRKLSLSKMITKYETFVVIAWSGSFWFSHTIHVIFIQLFPLYFVILCIFDLTTKCWVEWVRPLRLWSTLNFLSLSLSLADDKNDFFCCFKKGMRKWKWNMIVMRENEAIFF